MKYNPAIDSLEERVPHGRAPHRGRRRAISGTLLALLGLALFVWANFQLIEVRGDSMEPVLHNGERLLVSRAYWLVGPVKRNDIVVIRRPSDGEVLIKRVRGLGGDAIDWFERPVNVAVSGPYQVPQGMVYVLGDNIPNSQDSRYYGPLPLQTVIGKVVWAPKNQRALAAGR